MIDDGRYTEVQVLIAELKQYRRLEPLDLTEEELAHRMVMTVKQVRQIRKYIGGMK